MLSFNIVRRVSASFDQSVVFRRRFDDKNIESANLDTKSFPLNFVPEPNINFNSENKSKKNPIEVQKAVCTITAGEVKASAEAVTTKTLKGVCGSAELQLALANLERRIFKELGEIKILLQQQFIPLTPKNEVQNKNGSKLQNISRLQPPTATLTLLSLPEILPRHEVQNVRNAKDGILRVLQETSPKIKSLRLESREKEVNKFNNSMLADDDFKVFTFYWRIENFLQSIESKTSSSKDSPEFSIKGRPLYLKAFFQHLQREFLYLQLEYATRKFSRKNSSTTSNIMLDMGFLGGVDSATLFRAILNNDKISFKYKISILDQLNMQTSKDLVSQEFHNFEHGFLVPNSVLLGSTYIKNDTLLVQLFLYLL